MRMNDLNIKIRGMARAFTTIIPIFGILIGIIFRVNFAWFFGLFLLVCDFINHFVKKLFRWMYGDNETIWLLGRGIRPDGAKHCGSFINEYKMDGKATSFGMPSGHSQMAVTVGVMLILFLYDKYGMDTYNLVSMSIVALLCVGILVSRWWMNCHTVEQIFVGSVIGLIYGLVGWSLYKWVFGEKIIS